MKTSVLIDTGPLVAYLNRRDIWHGWVKKQLSEIAPPLLTCESVLSEACFSLRNIQEGPATLLELLERGLMTLSFRLENEISAVRKLMKRYRDVPISLAEACLVRMAERYGRSEILTLDSAFRIYRKHGRQIIPTIIPDKKA